MKPARAIATIQELENQLSELQDYVRRAREPLRIAQRQIYRLKGRIKRRQTHPNRVDVAQKALQKMDS